MEEETEARPGARNLQHQYCYGDQVLLEQTHAGHLSVLPLDARIMIEEWMYVIVRVTYDPVENRVVYELELV